jgi:hypothetical protein
VANLIWTGILYFSTLTIVYVVYRTFMNDRKAENERRTSDIVLKTQARQKEHAEAAVPRPAVRRPALQATR